MAKGVGGTVLLILNRNPTQPLSGNPSPQPISKALDKIHKEIPRPFEERTNFLCALCRALNNDRLKELSQ